MMTEKKRMTDEAGNTGNQAGGWNSKETILETPKEILQSLDSASLSWVPKVYRTLAQNSIVGDDFDNVVVEGLFEWMMI